MKLKLVDNSTFLGLFSGLIICNQSIRSLIYVNLISFFFLTLLLSLFYSSIKKISKQFYVISRFEILIYFLFFFVFTYSILSMFETGFDNVVYLVDLVLLSTLFFVGRLMNLQSLKCMIAMIFFVGIIHSFFLLFNRSYVYSSGVNYLLLSLVVGLLSCLSLLVVLKGQGMLLKVMGAGCFLLSWLALFSMQSRAIFIYSALFSVVMPFVVVSRKVKFYYFIFLSFFGFLFFSYFFNELMFLYESSKIYQRMNDLFFDFHQEQRFTTYGVYFSELPNFYLTGFGLGGTAEGIYSATLEKYPHNFILEFYSEFGVLGLLFSTAFVLRSLFLSFIHFKHTKESYWGLVIVAVYFFYLMNFMKSFSIYDSMVLFLAVGLVFNQQLSDEIRSSKRSFGEGFTRNV